MFENLFAIFDIPLSCILVMLIFFGTFFIKNVYNVFITLFIGIFLIIFIASTMLSQQIFLGEFLVIGIFFILTIIFFIFNLNDTFDDSLILEERRPKLKTLASVVVFVLTFAIVGLNFNKINNSKSKFIVDNSIVVDDLRLAETKDEGEYDTYIENISLLNQNKIFQKLTHIVMFYVCLVVVFYFFNRRSDNEG